MYQLKPLFLTSATLKTKTNKKSFGFRYILKLKGGVVLYIAVTKHCSVPILARSGTPCYMAAVVLLTPWEKLTIPDGSLMFCLMFRNPQDAELTFSSFPLGFAGYGNIL